MFDYRQRPWSRPLSDEEYNRAVGITPTLPAPAHVCQHGRVVAGLEINCEVCNPGYYPSIFQ